MPVPVDQAIVPHRLQLSNRSLVLCCVCFFATFFGASAITISCSLVLQDPPGLPAYWLVTAIPFLIVWFATLINMYRLTIMAILVDR